MDEKYVDNENATRVNLSSYIITAMMKRGTYDYLRVLFDFETVGKGKNGISWSDLFRPILYSGKMTTSCNSTTIKHILHTKTSYLKQAFLMKFELIEYKKA